MMSDPDPSTRKPGDRVATRVVGHCEPRYPGEPRSRREIRELVEPLTLRDHPGAAVSLSSIEVASQSDALRIAVDALQVYADPSGYLDDNDVPDEGEPHPGALAQAAIDQIATLASSDTLDQPKADGLREQAIDAVLRVRWGDDAQKIRDHGGFYLERAGEIADAVLALAAPATDRDQ